MHPIEVFKEEQLRNIELLGKNTRLRALGSEFMTQSLAARYSYNFNWLGRPIIQHPQDIVAFQELIWQIKPDLIIETGIAHGGSLILSASILELIGEPAKVVGIDIDIREHNRREVENHRMFKLDRIKMIEGSSIDAEILKWIEAEVAGKKRVLVFLDSNHAHDHVLRELELYSKFVTLGSYVVVADTVVEFMPKGMVKDRPWDKGSNPYTAVQEFLKHRDDFENDESWENKLIITACTGGFLKRVK